MHTVAFTMTYQFMDIRNNKAMFQTLVTAPTLLHGSITVQK